MIKAPLLTEEASFITTLSRLRWIAIAGQAITILLVSEGLADELKLPPLWAGVAALVAFNLFASWQLRGHERHSHAMAFTHLLVDVVVLSWMLAWSGGLTNPFGMMYLVLIALAAVALPTPWALATALSCSVGYGASALWGERIPLEGPFYNLHLLGFATSYLITATLLMYFTLQVARERRLRARELYALQERFTRNEGIVALATHAASTAHELNTPLATMTLLADELLAHAESEAQRDDLQTLRQLLVLCRERVKSLALVQREDLQKIIAQWRLVRPAVELHRQIDLPEALRVDPAVAHLVQALLNNAADASAECGCTRVDLRLGYREGRLHGEIRDYGPGFDPLQPLLPATLFRSSKSDGLGVGLALSHATVERFGGSMTLHAAADGGTTIVFTLPLHEEESKS